MKLHVLQIENLTGLSKKTAFKKKANTKTHKVRFWYVLLKTGYDIITIYHKETLPTLEIGN